MELIASIILIIVCVYVVKAPSYKAHNRLCPPGMKTDWMQMNLDKANGMSQRDIDIKSNRGGYDIPNDTYTTPARKR